MEGIKKMTILLVIVLLGIGGLLCKHVYTNVSSNYIDTSSQFKEIYKKRGERLLEDEALLVQRNGKFEKGYEVSEIVKEANAIEYVYAKSSDADIDNKLLYVVVKGDIYTFGDKKIKVGSSKTYVEKIMANSKRPKPNKIRFAYYDIYGDEIVTDVDVYCDDDYSLSVGFVYKNDCVEVIYIGPGPNL